MPRGLPVFVVRRLLLAIPVFIGVTLVTFILMYVVPGDPVTALVDEKMASTDPVAARLFREKWGLDAPVPVQYLKFLANAARGDLGLSYRSEQPVLKSILERFPATAMLAAASLGIAIILGIPLGILAAVRQNTALDSASIILATFGVSVPNFWLGLLLIYVIAVQLRWLPPSGYGPAFPYLIMPAITLGTGLSAVIARLTRSSMLEVIRQDYVRTARAKGLDEDVVINIHARKNALIPVITLSSLTFVGLLGGVVITETIFNFPGIGRWGAFAAQQLDIPGVTGFAMFVAGLTVLGNLAADILYAYFDPRVRLQ